MSFQVAFTNVLISLLYILPGFALCKVKKASAGHLPTLSGFLVFICAPCMVVSSFLKLEYSPAQLANMGIFFVISLVLQALFMAILFLLLHKKYDDSRYRILTIGSVLGNVGFFGLPLIQALLPAHPEVMCYSSICTISMNLLVFTMGVYCLTYEKKYLSLRSALLNPTMVGLVIGLPLYIFGAGKFLPEPLRKGVSLLGSMTTPLCMVILGIRLASVDFKKLFCRPFVYLACAGKLLVFPLFCYGLLYFLPIDQTLKTSMFILAATPCASKILNMAEIHKKETELSANCVLLSTLLCIVTIPLLMLLVR